jgi:catalase
MSIHANNAPYTPSTLHAPRQATQSEGRGFFTAPRRRLEGRLHRSLSPSFDDHWTQPRLFFNSLGPKEQQFLINGIRFETAHLTKEHIKRNVLTQLNRVSHHIAKQVAETLGMPAPNPDPKYYHENKTANNGVFGHQLKKLAGLKVGVLTTNKAYDARTVDTLRAELRKDGISVSVVAERLQPGVDATYSMTDAIDFDAVVVANGAGYLFINSLKTRSTLFPAGRPTEILQDAYRYGKPVAFAGDASLDVLEFSRIPRGPGVYFENDPLPPGRLVNGTESVGQFSNRSVALDRRAENATTADETSEAEAKPEAPGDIAAHLRRGLREFRFLDRFHHETI